MTGLRPDEQHVADLLADRLGGTIDPKDVDGAQATHEFDVVLPDGQRIAVEVTAAAEEDMERLHGAAGKRHPAPDLDADWWVTLRSEPEPNVKRVTAALRPLIATLERHGVEHVGGSEPDPQHPEAAQAAAEIARFGVQRVYRLGPPKADDDAALVLVLSRGVGAESLSGLVADLAERKAIKLAAAEAVERHLWVWVRHGGAELAMATLPPPDDAPELPPAVDVVWAATGNHVTGVRVLYRLPRGGAWESVQ